MKKLLLVAPMLLLAGVANAGNVTDFTKTVIERVPYTVEVCTNAQVPGDKTGDALKGAIIGGIIGNNIKGEENGGAIGAILGGMLGHSNSSASGGVQKRCEMTTRYNEKVVDVYSHSVVTFIHNGKQYSLRFQK